MKSFKHTTFNGVFISLLPQGGLRQVHMKESLKFLAHPLHHLPEPPGMFLLCPRSCIPYIFLLVVSQLKMWFHFLEHVFTPLCVHIYNDMSTNVHYGSMIDNRIPLSVCVCVCVRARVCTLRGCIRTKTENCADKEIAFVLDWNKVCFHKPRELLSTEEKEEEEASSMHSQRPTCLYPFILL